MGAQALSSRGSLRPQADGSFGLSYFKLSTMKLGYTGQASFRVTQHERDLIVLELANE